MLVVCVSGRAAVALVLVVLGWCWVLHRAVPETSRWASTGTVSKCGCWAYPGA